MQNVEAEGNFLSCHAGVTISVRSQTQVPHTSSNTLFFPPQSTD